MKYRIETEIDTSEIINEANASELIDLLDELIVALYEDGFDDIKEHMISVVDSIGELG